MVGARESRSLVARCCKLEPFANVLCVSVWVKEVSYNVATLALHLLPRQGLPRVRAKKEA
jgi:hypothetical protein